jgi:formate hydrogenlyase subunit 6/NADH:ubiquinone oxidoreductase subunit I
LKQGYDIQLTPIDNEFFVEIGSPKGQTLVEAHADLLAEATVGDAERKNAALAGLDQKFQRSTFVAYAMRKITRGEVPEEWWEELSQRCFGIAGCRYVCPTCTCFHVVDKVDGDGGTRQRCWDSCSFIGFTRMVSGETPRETPGSLLRRWGEHKLSFFYALRDGRHGCVGCGRCLTTCLGRGDTWNIVGRIRELSQQE